VQCDGMEAWIYARFSSDKQAEGYSLERQFSQGRAYVERMGWTCAADQEIKDEGKSAFDGGNRLEGSALHEFERRARAGHFKHGVVLCVENIDRLSRQGAKASAQLIWMLNENGVSVATWHDEHIYKAGADGDMMDIFSIVIKAQVANEESAKKSKRSLASWANKKERIRQGSKAAMSNSIPQWLAVDPATKIMQPIPERAAVLNEIFDWYNAGVGVTKIVRRLNLRDEPSWTVGARIKKNYGWGESYVHRLLVWRAVLGEYIYNDEVLSLDHYPQVISAEKFAQAQAVRASKSRSGGSTEYSGNNLFRGLARCGHCHGIARFIRKGEHSSRYINAAGETVVYARKHSSYLTCDFARRGHRCLNKTQTPYEPLESAVVEYYLGDADLKLGDHGLVEELKSKVAEQQRQIDGKRRQLNNIVALLAETPFKALAQKAQALEAEVEALGQTYDLWAEQLQIAVGSGSPDENLALFRGFEKQLNDPDPTVRQDARVRANFALHSIIEKIEIWDDGGTVVHMVNGGVFEFDSDGQRSGGTDSNYANL